MESLPIWWQNQSQQVYRLLCIGSSGCGKTFQVAKLCELERAAADKKQELRDSGTPSVPCILVIVGFIKDYGIDPYKCDRTYFNPRRSDIKDALQMVRDAHAANSESHYQLKFLFIFDDVIDESISKSDELQELFATCRHYNISLVYIMQSFTVYITLFMKNNVTHYLMFPIHSYEHRNRLVRDVLAPVTLKRIEEKKKNRNAKMRIKQNLSIELANSLYSEMQNRKYGFLLVNMLERELM